MNAGEIFVSFVIPAVILDEADLAVLADERAVRRAQGTRGT